MNQLAIDFTPRARASDPDTSHAAAAAIDGATLAARVLQELREHGPGTSHDLADRLGLSLVTVSPRIAPLQRAGKVYVLRKEGKRQVWVAA